MAAAGARRALRRRDGDRGALGQGQQRGPRRGARRPRDQDRVRPVLERVRHRQRAATREGPADRRGVPRPGEHVPRQARDGARPAFRSPRSHRRHVYSRADAPQVLTLLGGVSHVDGTGMRVRGESHMLLVGDAGTGKSQATPPRCTDSAVIPPDAPIRPCYSPTHTLSSPVTLSAVPGAPLRVEAQPAIGAHDGDWRDLRRAHVHSGARRDPNPGGWRDGATRHQQTRWSACVDPMTAPADVAAAGFRQHT